MPAEVIPLAFADEAFEPVGEVPPLENEVEAKPTVVVVVLDVAEWEVEDDDLLEELLLEDELELELEPEPEAEAVSSSVVYTSLSRSTSDFWLARPLTILKSCEPCCRPVFENTSWS